jgi:hypothetical protein
MLAPDITALTQKLTRGRLVAVIEPCWGETCPMSSPRLPTFFLLLGAMAFAIVGQVGDAVPLTIAVFVPRSSCPLQTDIGEMRILQADIVFELCVSCGSGESYLRRRRSLVPRPTHTCHPALKLWSAASDCAYFDYFDEDGAGAGAGAITGGGAAGATGATMPIVPAGSLGHPLIPCVLTSLDRRARGITLFTFVRKPMNDPGSALTRIGVAHPRHRLASRVASTVIIEP